MMANFSVRNRVLCVTVLCLAQASDLSLTWAGMAKNTNTPSDDTTLSPVALQCQGPVLPTPEEMFATRAVQMCSRVTSDRVEAAQKNALRLLQIESEMGIPEMMRGMTLAAACMESGFKEKAQGDHRFDPKGRPKAIGILQLWPWVKKYDVKRRELESSGRFWVGHVQRVKAKTDRICQAKSKEKRWQQAWVTAVRAPKKGGRCRERPLHWKMFKRLQAERAKILKQTRSWYNEPKAKS